LSNVLVAVDTNKRAVSWEFNGLVEGKILTGNPKDVSIKYGAEICDFRKLFMVNMGSIVVMVMV